MELVNEKNEPIRPARYLGVLVLIVGAGLSYISMGIPLSQAKRGVAEIHTSEHLVLLSVCAVVMGSMLTIFGNAALAIVTIGGRNIREIKLWQWLMYIGAVAADFVLYANFDGLIESLGYQTLRGPGVTPYTFVRSR